MTDDIKAIFQEYTRLRASGLGASEAVHTLHSYLQRFDKDARDELARNMRAWENKRIDKIDLIDPVKRTQTMAIPDTSEIACPHCGKQNIQADSICYSCGQFLHPQQANATNILKKSEQTCDGIHFSDQHILLLETADNDVLELRPQASTGQMLIGRLDEANGNNINLEPLGASAKGVSRIHATLAYDEASKTLLLFDMGSTNGTYINKRILHENERRTLRHGDELQFGNLILYVIYKKDK